MRSPSSYVRTSSVIGAAAFRHEALLHEGDDGFLEASVPFIREGLEAGEPVLVAVSDHRLTMLGDALGTERSQVTRADMREVGHKSGTHHPGVARLHRRPSRAPRWDPRDCEPI
jgi:hypothetical protein